MPQPPDSYLTLGGLGDDELKVQRSRFVASAGPAATEDDAREFIAAMNRRYHDSRHVCFAFRLGLDDDAVEIRGDDGEPSGTAGEPILLAIRGAGLTDTVVAVARYFGGVKLGTGGLTRAYGGVAATAIEKAPRRTVLLGRLFGLTFDYNQQKTVQHLLEAHGGRTDHEEYGVQVDWRIWLPHSTWEAFTAAIREATANRIEVRPLG